MGSSCWADNFSSDEAMRINRKVRQSLPLLFAQDDLVECSFWYMMNARIISPVFHIVILNGLEDHLFNRLAESKDKEHFISIGNIHCSPELFLLDGSNDACLLYTSDAADE